MDRLVAVMGATGRTGKHIVEKLLEKDIRVRILSRNLSKAKKMFGNHVEVIAGDLLKTKDLKSLVSGVSHLFVAHGADLYPGERGYELIDFGGLDKALDSMPANQHTHIIYMSSIYAERHLSVNEPVGRPFYWKKLTERMLQGSGNPYTIVRPGWLNNNKGGTLQIVAEQGDQGEGEISREDVAEVMVKAMDFESAIGKIFEVYNVPVIPVNHWDNFFSELKSEVMDTCW